MTSNRGSQESVQAYWREPEKYNEPANYASKAIGRSLFLIDCISRHAEPGARILEIGCNAGRNLAFLYHAGYRKLSGVEINERAVAYLRSNYRELKKSNIIISSVEDAIKSMPDDSYDVIFTMAVLEHVHTDSDWIFAELVRVGKKIITIEDESHESWKHFSRNYGEVFTGLGLTQVEYLERVPNLPTPFRARVFARPSALFRISRQYAAYSGFDPWRELNLEAGPERYQLDLRLLNVLSLVVAGKDAHEIAERLMLSDDAVEILLRNFVAAGWCKFKSDYSGCEVNDADAVRPTEEVLGLVRHYIGVKWIMGLPRRKEIAGD